MHHGIEQQSHRRLTSLDTLGQSQSSLHIPADGLQTVLELLVAVVLLPAAGVVAAVVLVTAFGHGRDAYVKLESKQWGATSIGWRLLVPRTRRRLVTITTPVMTQPVVAPEQVQCCVQVRVDLVYSVADGLQSRPPVGGLRLLLPGGRAWETSAGERDHQENTGEAAVEHSPLPRRRHEPAVFRRL